MRKKKFKETGVGKFLLEKIRIMAKQVENNLKKKEEKKKKKGEDNKKKDKKLAT